MKNILTIFATGLAALAASACCWIPALLGAGAASSLGLGAVLAPYRPYLLGLTAVFLTAGFTMAYRKPGDTCCNADGCLTDAAQRKRWTKIGSMWTIAVFAVGVAAYPYIGQVRPTSENGQSKTGAQASATSSREQVIFRVDGMDCTACAAPIQEHVEKVVGVESATIDFASETLIVQTSAVAPSDLDIVSAVEAAGFKATKKQTFQ